MYDPFVGGPFRIEVTTFTAYDAKRDRTFSCETWCPIRNRSSAETASATYPLVVFSHFSGGNRSSSSFLCAHLASHGYVVAALDHSDAQLPKPSEGTDSAEKQARLRAWIDARVPDVRFLIDSIRPGAKQVGIVGHSFGGWTALAAPVDGRIAAVVALAPAGSSNPRPGVIPATLDFAWGRDVPTLIIAGERDVSIPLDRAREIFDRNPATKKFVAVRNADHLHFVDDAQAQHERVRAMTFPANLAWIQMEMRPFAELRSEHEAHEVIRGLTLAHFDATLKHRAEAGRFLDAHPEFV